MLVAHRACSRPTILPSQLPYHVSQGEFTSSSGPVEEACACPTTPRKSRSYRYQDHLPPQHCEHIGTLALRCHEESANASSDGEVVLRRPNIYGEMVSCIVAIDAVGVRFPLDVLLFRFWNLEELFCTRNRVLKVVVLVRCEGSSLLTSRRNRRVFRFSPALRHRLPPSGADSLSRGVEAQSREPPRF